MYDYAIELDRKIIDNIIIKGILLIVYAIE